MVTRSEPGDGLPRPAPPDAKGAPPRFGPFTVAYEERGT
jgi:hypothetical protein